MKFKFESNLEHQELAINSVVDIFEGISSKESLFSISKNNLKFNANDGIGIGNQITTNNWQTKICQPNLQRIQKENGLNISNVNVNLPTFDIEMETGTGKTYVFLKTILQLSNKYDFKKFIIIVPSIAIKEGIKKTLEITKDHFNSLFPGVTYKASEYVSDEASSLIWSFSNNDNVEILIMNIQQMNKMNLNDEKKSNILYKNLDSLSGEKPIDLLKKTNPIVIIDEPQSTASGIQSSEAIKYLNPLFILRYSATFKKRTNENLVYKLDPIDAYNKKLVKKIVVYTPEIKNENTQNILIKLQSVDIKQQSAKISIKKFSKINNTSNWKSINVKKNDNLSKASKLDEYEDLFIEEIDFQNEKIILSNGNEYNKNSKYGNYEFEIKKDQISKTILKHLEKQKQIKDRGIKVLSLFFIDKVEKYRKYDKNKNPILGEYAEIFEQEFNKILLNNKKFWDLFNITNESQIKTFAKKVHDGYFSIDSKNKFKDTKGEAKEDASTYNKIMKDKERLLSFNEKLCFIFSHSALKEGWDNPNVFQICTLNDSSKSEIKKRQEIGRGLRLCVDQNGYRVHDEVINELSIFANDTYEEFVEKLQKEFKEDGIVFGLIENSSFENKDLGITLEKSKKLWEALIINGYLNKKGKIIKCDENVKEVIHLWVLENKLDHNEQQIVNWVENILNNSKRKPSVKNGNVKKQNKINEDVIKSKEFTNLWNSINQKTIYNIKFNSEDYVKKVQNLVKKEINNSNKTKIISTKSEIEMSKSSGIQAKNIGIDSIEEIDNVKMKQWIPDIISDIEEATSLTRKTIIDILNDIEIIEKLKNNYEWLKNILIKKMNEIKIDMMIEGIEYKKIDDFYKQETLISEELDNVYDEDSSVDTKQHPNKYPYDYVLVDSLIEKEFAKDSLNSNIVINFLKLPKWFKIKTPLGNYNPDWAIYKKDYMAFVAETKGTNDHSNLRKSEKQKIDCGEKHFKSISDKIKYIVGTNFEEIINKAGNNNE